MNRIDIVAKLVAAEMQCERFNRPSNWFCFEDHSRQVVSFCGRLADLIIDEDKESSDD